MPDRRGEDNERLSIESPSCHTHRRSYLPERTTRRAGATGKLLSKLLAIGEREQTENNRFPINKHRRIWLSYRGGGTDSDPHDRYLPKENPEIQQVTMCCFSGYDKSVYTKALEQITTHEP